MGRLDVYKRQILTEPKNAVVRQYRKMFQLEDVELELSLIHI